jgi:hypothetical protein
MNGDEVRGLRDDEFIILSRKKLTKAQIAELDSWAEDFEAMPLHWQIPFAHYIVHDFLGIAEGDEDEATDADGEPLPASMAKFGGGMFG